MVSYKIFFKIYFHRTTFTNLGDIASYQVLCMFKWNHRVKSCVFQSILFHPVVNNGTKYTTTTTQHWSRYTMGSIHRCPLWPKKGLDKDWHPSQQLYLYAYQTTTAIRMVFVHTRLYIWCTVHHDDSHSYSGPDRTHQIKRPGMSLVFGNMLLSVGMDALPPKAERYQDLFQNESDPGVVHCL